jgi:hypothetical protein
MGIDQPDPRKLLFGTLFVGASALPAGTLISGLLAGVGGNWVAEAVGGVIGAGPPPGAALTRAFARAVQSAATQLRREYGEERARRDGQDAFELLRQAARGITAVDAPAGSADLVGVQRTVAGGLDQLLQGFPDAQVRLVRERLLPTTARAFHAGAGRRARPRAQRLARSSVVAAAHGSGIDDIPSSTIALYRAPGRATLREAAYRRTSD